MEKKDNAHVDGEIIESKLRQEYEGKLIQLSIKTGRSVEECRALIEAQISNESELA